MFSSNEILRGDLPGAERSPELPRPSLEDGELLLEMLGEFQDGGHVTATVAVVGCRPHRQAGLVEVPFVSEHVNIMQSRLD